jgi:hypothetical protein
VFDIKDLAAKAARSFFFACRPGLRRGYAGILGKSKFIDVGASAGAVKDWCISMNAPY